MNIPFNQFPIFGNLGHFVMMNIVTQKCLCPEKQSETKSLGFIFCKMGLIVPISKPCHEDYIVHIKYFAQCPALSELFINSNLSLAYFMSGLFS